MTDHTDPPETCRACVREHLRCLEHWDSLPDDVRRGTTFHGPEAHHLRSPDGGA